MDKIAKGDGARVYFELFGEQLDDHNNPRCPEFRFDQIDTKERRDRNSYKSRTCKQLHECNRTYGRALEREGKKV